MTGHSEPGWAGCSDKAALYRSLVIAAAGSEMSRLFHAFIWNTIFGFSYWAQFGFNLMEHSNKNKTLKNRINHDNLLQRKEKRTSEIKRNKVVGLPCQGGCRGFESRFPL